MKRLIVALFVCLAPPAFAEVTAASTGGFTVAQQLSIDAPAEIVWESLTTELSAWWNPALTVSGDASRMRLELSPGGCLCERLAAANGIEHLRVTGVRAPGFLRLQGGLGPLGLMGVSGNMTIELITVDASTRVELIYAVGGYHPDGLDTLAEPVDGVMADLLERLRQHSTRGDND